MESELILFSGNANLPLAKRISQYLDIPLGKAQVTQFSDGETRVELMQNVRGTDAYLIQPMCSPANHNIMEAVIMIDALRRSSAKSIVLVCPYYGYSRQERKSAPRTPITAKPVLVDSVRKSLGKGIENAVVVSPDAGGAERARAYAKHFGCGMAIIDKRRDRPNESAVAHIIGEVKGKSCVIVDDIVDTAGSLTKAAEALLEAGAESVTAAIVHPVLSGPAIERIKNSKLDSLLVTDSIPLTHAALSCEKIQQVSVSELLAKAIRRIHNQDSISKLFI